ncbi:MAG: DUF1573 domain-containing protein [Bacteroidia bacterium]|nr:DUF1573 domain-containing protein [Bacteroidia bacterium]
MKSLFLILATLLLSSPDFDQTVHDFGTVGLKDGPQTCTFTYTNETEEDVLILAVVSSCGCTEVDWTRTKLAPGQSGTVTATYSNEDGPFPFDKTLTVYLSNQKKPVILHLKGVVKRNAAKQ